jgi:L-iduronidase
MKLFCDFSKPARPVSIDWRWTGFTPGGLLLGDDMKQTLRYLGAVPRSGVRHVRIHLLLELVSARGLGTDAPEYDWISLDEGLDALVGNGLAPFFELMGNPSGYFTDYSDPVQLTAWKDLVRDLALHLQDRYGREEVESWFFETWNEPDCGWWHQSIDNFLKYYDACSEGLKEANPALKFGGPGTARFLSTEIKALLAHVDKGVNALTGKQDVRMDFLSVHEKGAFSCEEDIPVSPERMVRNIRGLRQYLKEHHPRLLDLPIMNNECDPQVGWKNPHTWRATAFYPAIMAKGLFHHFDTLVDEDGLDFTFFGNDNGFIGGWPQRTQLCRIARKGHETEWFDLIKKPALQLMTALSLAGPDRIPVQCEQPGSVYSLPTRLPDGEGAALFVCAADNRCRTASLYAVDVEVKGLVPGEYTLIQYRIDEAHGNSYRVWEDHLPDWDLHKWVPDGNVIAAMRSVQELARFGELETVKIESVWTRSMELPLPGFHVFLLLRKEAFQPPGAVQNLRVEPFKGVDNSLNILVSWKPPPERSVVDHRVEFRADTDSSWQELEHPPLLDGTVVHTLKGSAAVPQYRVTPVDAWGRTGKSCQSE